MGRLLAFRIFFGILKIWKEFLFPYGKKTKSSVVWKKMNWNRTNRCGDIELQIQKITKNVRIWKINYLLLESEWKLKKLIITIKEIYVMSVIFFMLKRVTFWAVLPLSLREGESCRGELARRENSFWKRPSECGVEFCDTKLVVLSWSPCSFQYDQILDSSVGRAVDLERPWSRAWLTFLELKKTFQL